MGGAVTLPASRQETTDNSSRWTLGWSWLALMGVCFLYAGDAAPGVNEAHYFVKAKNFWQPDWCANDLFAASGKAHATYYWLFGWPTRFLSLNATAWAGRLVGWSLLAAGLLRLTRAMRMPPMSSVWVMILWILGIQHGNLAGEWVIGGIEAKVPAYGLVLFGLAEIVQRRWSRGWIWFGAAAGFHVLTGGWSVVAAAIAFLLAERGPKQWRVSRSTADDRSSGGYQSPGKESSQGNDVRPLFFSRGLFVGGALSLFGLIPAAAMSWGATDAEQISAARIYAYFRISHHLMPAAFHFDWYIRHSILTIGCLVCLAFAWWQMPIAGIKRPKESATDSSRSEQAVAFRILGWFAIGAMTISLVGLLIGLLPAIYPDQAAKLLRFYWFRLADAVTPLVFAFLLVHFFSPRNNISTTADQPGSQLFAVVWLGRAGMVAAIVLFAQASWERIQTGVPVSVSNRMLGLNADADYAEQRRTMEDWIAVCQFIRSSTPDDAVLLTPRHQQTFKWYAHRAEVVNWKDTPQNAVALREWAKRFLEVYPARLSTMRVTIRYDDLRAMRAKYGCDWIVVDRRVVGPELPLVQIYPASNQRNSTYAVYELP
ncbi:DUF6798 domain-containing protein [Rhodopirellula baltica]|uniref:DUF6798 domain-containing protein n=1 Tax=Rhodopirellula baltica WH47 TaxID=991778 RepID=F2AMX1_RHOBT|nr:conserved hypothetical protein, membrane [Rhodopirellula baltica WH47]